ncbi:MAG: protein kinase [Ktedonobacteraceae bacterium]|nr:protein kinase [Ktedonobacteraceae bacterium]MBO0793237.1 protein kinase [Ktedonobacteraceae bacterium]
MSSEQFFVVGKQIGNYRIVAPIAAGAYGTVYRAEHQVLSGRVAAIKILHAYLGSTGERERFVREAQFLELVHHPNMIPILDAGFYNGIPYLITAYAPGGSLRELLNQHHSEPLPLPTALNIISQVGAALHHAHQGSIVHRDLKPENILFNGQGEALLADFGLASTLSSASIRQTGHVGGTPSYMAPEQFKGTICRESDQYALGCILYEMVTGRRPFSASDFISMGFKHATDPPTPPSEYNPQLPRHVEQAILKAMAKQHTDRYPDVQAFINALQPPGVLSSLKNLPVKALLTRSRQVPAVRRQGEPDTHDKQRQDYSASLAAFEQSIQKDPNYARSHNKRGLVLMQFQQYQKALACFEQARQLDPDNPEYRFNLGLALFAQEQYKEALPAFEQAISLDPKNSLYRNQRGETLYELGHFQEALTCFDQAILLKAEQAAYHLNRARTLQKLQHLNAALASSEKACALDSTTSGYHFTRGQILFEISRYEEACSAYDLAIHLDPSNGLYHARKAKALDILGKSWQARQASTTARKLGYKGERSLL